jgi:Glycine zipper
MSLDSKIILVFIATFLTFLASAIALAGDTALPPSTNPANHAIFPAKGQDADQQMEDQLAAYNWATRQTGWDPYKAHDKLVSQGHAAEQTAEQARGGLFGGAARGALVGLAVGAIAGDAGKGAAIGATAGGLTGGMRSRRTQREAQSTTDQAIETFNRQFANWDKNYVAAMEGHGYTVE